MSSRRFPAFASLLAVLCSSLVIGALTSQADEHSLSPQFIPASAFAAVVAHPKETLHSKELELLPHEVISAAGIEEWGFDPTQIRQAIAFVTMGETLQQPPQFGVILRFDEKVELSDRLLQSMEKKLHNDRPYYESRRPDMPSFYLPEPTTLLLAPGNTLREMAEAKDVGTPLVKLLAADAPTSHVTGYVAVEQIQKQLKAASAGVPVPPPFRPLLTIPDHLQSLKLQVDPEKGGLFMNARLTMTAYNEDSAEEIDEILNNSMRFGIAMAMEQARQGLDEEEPIEKATLAYLTRLGGAIQELVKPERDGKTLVMNLDGDIATPAVLVALLLPAINAAREAARRNMSMNNLRQIAIGMQIHESSKRAFPAAANFDAEGKALLSWRVHMLPYLEEQALYEKFHLNEPWDSEHNRKLIELMPEIYENPNDLPAGMTNYLAVVGEGTAFDGKKGQKLSDFRDGISNTILVVEANADQAVPWTKPSDLEVDLDRPFQGLGEFRGFGFMAVFADGHVQTITADLADETLKALFTRAGGEVVRDF